MPQMNQTVMTAGKEVGLGVLERNSTKTGREVSRDLGQQATARIRWSKLGSSRMLVDV